MMSSEIVALSMPPVLDYLKMTKLIIKHKRYKIIDLPFVVIVVVIIIIGLLQLIIVIFIFVVIDVSIHFDEQLVCLQSSS